MNTRKHNALLAFGLTATLNLGTAYAQSEHDGHHPQNAPAEQAAPQATLPKPGQGGMMQGMDHDKMMQMHDEHMGKGQMMDHGNMGQGGMGNGMNKDAGQGKPHDH
ncbi:hypothetical protein BAY1663_03017 [Pseudomonas sp. BAY1663]|uniref:hypothetical protein n=1 Tax=Pseudomonas sp. BAY1663 TaxID=1439940 RepID=UPI00042DF4B3|nr:hypothetical protein [Pseudomonas sp. BAY1663]EXF44548.1 hypothetical protein BAY1663_03017 [Pseudomonas sp. BAY1663]